MSKAAKVGLGVAVAVALALGGLWFWLSSTGEGEEAFELSAGDRPSGEAATEPSGAPPEGAGAEPADLSGTWPVEGGGASEAGYRMEEELLAFAGTKTVTGRTTDVTGEVVLEGTTVVAVEVEVDTTTLASDDPRRDEALRTRYLETDRFPTAAFRLTEPVELGELPEPLRPVAVEAAGELTLHGVTRPVTAQLLAQLLEDGRIEVVGTVPVVLADHDIERPDIAGVVSARDRGEVEMRLVLAPPGP